MTQVKKLFMVCLAITIFMIQSGAVLAVESEKININTASVEELVELDRIGPKYAQRIVAYREKHGDFENPENIMDVKSIGPKVFKANKDRIAVK